MGWIRRREEKGYFSSIVRELRTEDTVGNKAMHRMSYEDCKVILQTFSLGHQCNCGSMQTGATMLRYVSPVIEQ